MAVLQVKTDKLLGEGKAALHVAFALALIRTLQLAHQHRQEAECSLFTQTHVEIEERKTRRTSHIWQSNIDKQPGAFYASKLTGILQIH